MRNNLYKSRRGDIPITILVIEVLAICSLAIFSFISYNFFSSNIFLATSSLENINVMIDDYAFYKNMGLSEEKIEEFIDIDEDVRGKYIFYEKSISRFSGFQVYKSYYHTLKYGEFVFSAKYYLQ